MLKFIMGIISAIVDAFKPQQEPAPIKIEIPNPPDISDSRPDFAETVEKPAPRFVVDKSTHKFMGIKYIQDPDMGGPMIPRGIIIHFTCSYNMDNTVNWFKTNGVDIHLLVDKHAQVVQMVPFNKKAAHAGESEWGKLEHLNNHFLGIEAINIGPLVYRKGQYYDCYDRVWRGETVSKKMFGYNFWEPQSAAQVEATVAMCAVLCREYKIDVANVVGHSEVSPGRKTDPGGTLPMSMDEFRKLVKKEMGLI